MVHGMCVLVLFYLFAVHTLELPKCEHLLHGYATGLFGVLLFVCMGDDDIRPLPYLFAFLYWVGWQETKYWVISGWILGLQCVLTRLP